MPRAPYVPPLFDRSRYTARVSDLIRQRGDAEAAAHLRSAEIGANLAQNLGHIVSSSLQGYAQQRQQQDATKRERLFADAILDADAKGLTPDQVLPTLRKIDPIRTAKMLETLGTQRQQQLTAVRQRIDAAAPVFGRGAQILQEIERNPAVYPEIRPKLVELASAVDPSLASEIPETYDPTAVKGMLQFVTGAAQQAEQAKRGLTALQTANEQKTKGLNSATSERKAAAEWLSGVATSEQWDQAKARLSELGVSRDLLAEFGDWSPEAPAKAAQRALTAEQRAKLAEEPSRDFNFRDYLTAAAREQGRPVGSFGKGEVEALRAKWMAAGREPDKPPKPDTLSATQRASIEARKRDDLAQLEREFKKTIAPYITDISGQLIPAGPSRPQIPQEIIDEHEAAKQRLEDSYRVQLGLLPTQRIYGTREDERRAATEAPPPSPTAPASVVAPSRPPPSARVAPPAAPFGPGSGRAVAQPAVPPAVQQLLGTLPAGIHELSDGSVWQKAESGAITRVK